MPDIPERILGDNTFTEQPVKRVTAVGSPVRTIRTFIGPQAQADSFETSLKSQYSVLNMNTQKGAPCVIELETDETPDGTDADARVLAEVVWSLEWEREMKDIRAHGYFHESQVTPKIMEEIDLAIKKGNSSNTDYNAKYSMTHMNTYRDLRLKGINSYIFFAPVVRATLTMGRFTKLKTPRIAAQTIVSWGEITLPFMAGEAMTPSVAGIDQPTSIYYDENSGRWATTDLNEWMLCPVRRGYTRQPKRYEMNFEWLGAEKWNKALYYNGSGSPP